MSVDVFELFRVGVLKVAVLFFLSGDFELSQVECFFFGGSLFLKSFLVGLDRGGLGLEFLLFFGGGVLFLLCGIEFLLIRLLGLFEFF